MDQTIVNLMRKINRLESDLARLKVLETGPSLGEMYSTFLGLPWLRGYWPMSSLDELVAVRDLGGQARTLSITGGVGSGIHNSLAPYLTFNGTTGYLSRANEAGLQITGNLTIGGWFWCNAFSGGQTLISKDLAASRGYNLYFTGTGAITSEMWTSNVANSTVTSAATGAANAWHFCAARYTPSTELAVFYDGAFTKNTTAIVASVQNSTSVLSVGSTGGGASNFLNGRAAPVFICREALPDTLLTYLFARTRAIFGV